ncbi:MAG: hypothetical protein JXA94_06280 [Parachlamydiales bacterium]|nr:hypothetical protein [Parachlamydiales bacterium]
MKKTVKRKKSNHKKLKTSAHHSKKAEPSKYRGQLNNVMKKLDNSYKKLEKDIEKHAPFDIIEKDNNELLLLLGECNYMVREFHLFEKEIKGRKK